VTPLQLLWNGWRADYVQTAERSSDPAGTSVFTKILSSGLSDDETHIVFRGAEVFALLNAFPYTVGHLMVLPYRQIALLQDLTPSESSELWTTVTAATQVIRNVMKCDGLNVGLNLGRVAGGSISEHLHVHVVPRWLGDSNFMTATANTRTLPESLPSTAAKIRAAWAETATTS
jgi:ATP adenylyltransferase